MGVLGTIKVAVNIGFQSCKIQHECCITFANSLHAHVEFEPGCEGDYGGSSRR